MVVKELIELLSAYEDDNVVVVRSNEVGYDDIDSIFAKKVFVKVGRSSWEGKYDTEYQYETLKKSIPDKKVIVIG